MFSLVLLLVTATSADCAPAVVLGGRVLRGGPRAFCIREVLQVRVGDEPLIAVRVDAPHRFETRVRSRVFLYRLRDGQLTPRFLGSGFSTREVTKLFVLDGALGLDTLTTTGEQQKLRCVFDGFPLVCTELDERPRSEDPALHAGRPGRKRANRSSSPKQASRR